MARLTAPLLSLGAAGKIGDAIVFANWKGIDYARRWVVPANPNTANQQEVRGIFSTLAEMYKRMDAHAREPWVAAVRGLPLTDRNRHVQANVAVLQGEADLDNLVMSVASGQAIVPDNVVTADGADGTATWTADAPTPPVDYTLIDVYGVAVLDGDPSPALVRTTYWSNAGGAPWAGAIDVPVDGTYQVGIFAVWQRGSDSLLFYSIADRSQVAVTGN